MIAQVSNPRAATAPGTPSLVGNKVPLPHRFFLTDGRTIVGEIHKAPNNRLTDHLSTLKEFVSVTNASCETSGRAFPYIVVNRQHILFIEEINPPQQQMKVTTPSGLANAVRPAGTGYVQR